ncbi:MAG TPA: polyphosphate kinase 1 [Spirochaetia bacterium]|nr:polyphosphate kinase 1 [Spirochaetia bacterium]
MPDGARSGERAVVLSPDLGDPSLFIDREISLLDFFRRVLEEAQDPGNPLLERVRFLAIVSSNLAEFFMVRVSGLKQQVEAGVVELSLAGLTPTAQLQTVRMASQELMLEARVCLRELIPLLEKERITIVPYDELTTAQRASVDHYYQELIFPVLTPLAVDPGRPFPHISNMSLNLALVIRDSGGHERFARVKLPATLPRLLPVPTSLGGAFSFVWLDAVVSRNLASLFPGMTVVQSYPFRVTRDAEVSIQELEAEDLLETIERGVRQRRFGKVVRVTVDPEMPAAVRDILVENLEVEPHDIYTLEPPLGMSDISQLHDLDRPDLKFQPFVPAIPSTLRDPDINIFAAIRREDILLHHPYDSFTPVVEFLAAAARDPAVLAIKQTLYRVGRNSPVVETLLEAARQGKQVAVLVELKARFDEESNIEWARALESEGVHVVYGLLGLKTHSKIALVVRQDGDRIRRYVHLSTGNYNSVTAQQYTDLGLFTCDDAIGADASDVFNYLTGYSDKRQYRKFLVAPINLRSGLEALIRREMERQSAGGQGHLIFKVNALVDKPMIQLLYAASQVGVRVDLLVRGMCCLRPGISGVSENIHVISIVGRFLEHSRVFWFRNGGQEEVYLGSADLMGRNLDRRVEILFPVSNPRLVRHLRDDVLATYLSDTAKARVMAADGVYTPASRGNGKTLDAQAEFIRKRGGA